MKNFFLILSLTLFAQLANAQGIFTKERVLNRENHDKKKYRWGYFLGFNSLDYKINYTRDRALNPAEIEDQDIEVKKTTGFNVGLIGELRINDYVDLRIEPGVVFSNKQLRFNDIQPVLPTDNVRELKTTLVHLPFLVKLSTKRLNNFKPFIIGGVSTSINLSSNEDNPDDNAAGTFRTKTNFSSYELGFGIDFYLPYFKFTPAIRGVFSISDEVVQDKDQPSLYTTQIDKLSTRGIFINFTFQ